MAAIYEGPHIIILNRNEKNLGLVGHINHVMEMVTGELVVVAAGDDISLPERTDHLCKIYLSSHKRTHSLYSQAIRIDGAGNHLGKTDTRHETEKFTLEKMAEQQIGLLGSTQAWHHDVFRIFGTIDTQVISEDNVIPFRALLLGDVEFVDKALVYYRYHDNNMWQHPRTASGSVIAVWHRKRAEKLLINMLGIWKTKIEDLDTAIFQWPDRKLS
ncbi:MAG: hypothetical protein IPJ94_16325 [Chloroflexi bacterium]|nr:hypothetical protein [Chloroflexota bacterium]